MFDHTLKLAAIGGTLDHQTGKSVPSAKAHVGCSLQVAAAPVILKCIL